MGILVTAGAEGDEVWLGIVTQTASWLNVVNLKVGRPAAGLAAPAVPLQHLLAQLTIGFWVAAGAGSAREQTSHEAFLNCSRNCFCCGGGRN